MISIRYNWLVTTGFGIEASIFKNRPTIENNTYDLGFGLDLAFSLSAVEMSFKVPERKKKKSHL